MNKSFSSRRPALKAAALLAVSFVVTCPALAQNSSPTTQVAAGATAPAGAPAKAIGPAPANSRQNKILKSALSPETRQTLQQAMDSYADADK